MAPPVFFERVLEEGLAGGEQPFAGVVGSEAVWSALQVRAELPEGTDFAQHLLLVVVSGQRPDLSYTLRILEVLDLEPVLGAPVGLVLYEEGTDGPPADAIGYPISVVRVARSGRHYLFAKR